MSEIIKKALRATRESKQIEFKRGFDPTCRGEWCEITKDIVALANSGGGILVFGLDSKGSPTGDSVESIACEDPADILNKVARYIDAPSFEIESVELEKQKNKLHAHI
jgi:predicted HTH transcriptional regulator